MTEQIINWNSINFDIRFICSMFLLFSFIAGILILRLTKRKSYTQKYREGLIKK